MFCENCGKKINKKDIFCEFCGSQSVFHETIKPKKADIIHDFDNLPEHLVSECSKCGSKYNNAEDSTCLKCETQFFRKGFKPRGMTDGEIESALQKNSLNLIDSIVREEEKIEEVIKHEKKRSSVYIKKLLIWIRKKIRLLASFKITAKGGFKNNQIYKFLLPALFLVWLLIFSYISIYKLGAPIENKSVFVSYYLLQFYLFKKALVVFAIFSVPLAYYWTKSQKSFSWKKYSVHLLLIVAVSFFAFNSAFLCTYVFAFSQKTFINYKIKLHPKSNGLIWSKEDLVSKLNSENNPPKIIKAEDNINNQIVKYVVACSNNKGQFYQQLVLTGVLKRFPANMNIPNDSPVTMYADNLYVKNLDKDIFEAISPILAKLMIEKEVDGKDVKVIPEMHLMDRQEYNQFREDQINEVIARLDTALAKVTKVVNSYASAVSYDKGKINYNVDMANLTVSVGNSSYSNCINAQDTISHYVAGTCSYYPYTYCSPGYFTYTYEPRYSYGYCENMRNSYNDEIDQYNSEADNWRVQLQSDQYELNIYTEIRKIIAGYKEMAIASKDDIPYELGVFAPPNNIKIAIDSTDTETLADYFGTVIHEYYHYTSYISSEKSLPTFFEEGLTEYFARKAVKDDMGIETNEGYPLIVKVIERMMDKIPEKDFQNIYFTKDSDLLVTTLDNAFGKNFSKDNELYFEYISYIPSKDALEITNKLLDKIGATEITEDDLFSKSSKF